MGIKKVFKWTIIILIISTISVGIFAYFSAQNIVNTYVKNTIIERYNSNPDIDYHVTFEKIKLDLLNGGVKLLNIKVEPKDSLVILVTNLNQKLRTNTYLNVAIKEISISGFNYNHLINSRQITAKKFQILSPKISIYTFEGLPVPVKNEQDTVDLRSIFLTNFDSFHLALVNVKNISVAYNKVSLEGDTAQVFSVENLSYSFKKVVANNSTLFSDHYFDYSLFTLNSKKITSQIGDKTSIAIGAIQYSSEDKQLRFKNILFEPLASPSSFFKKQKFRKAWIKFQAKEIQLEQISLDHWLTHDQFQLEKLQVIQPKVTVHTNSNLPLDPKRVQKLLGEIITQIKTPINVKEVSISGGSIIIDMLGKLTENHAKMKFNSLDLHAFNITNMPSEIAKNNILDIQLNTNPMNAGQLNAEIKIDLADPKSATSFNLFATNLDLTKFNKVTAPLIRITVRDGDMVTLDVKSTINTHGANGIMDAHYEDLKLQVENKEVDESPKFLDKTISTIANGYLKNDNIPLAKNYRTGKIEIIKQPNDGFFKLLWLVVITGLEDSVLGSEKRDKKQLKKANKEPKTKLQLKNKLFK